MQKNKMTFSTRQRELVHVSTNGPLPGYTPAAMCLPSRLALQGGVEKNTAAGGDAISKTKTSFKIKKFTQELP